MNKDGVCYSRPLKIKSWDKNIDYVMFVDENGNADSISHILDNIIKGMQFMMMIDTLLLRVVSSQKRLILL